MTISPNEQRPGTGAVWTSDGVLTVDGAEFATRTTPQERRFGRTMLLKQPDLVERHLELYQSARGGNVVELGVFEGASAMLLALVAAPRKLVTIDIIEPKPELEAFVLERALTDRVVCHWGIDQGDHPTLSRLIDEDFGGEAIDLVIDDASHDLDLTRVSFDVLFPRVRPGGRFIIEDWRWSEAIADGVRQELTAHPPEHQAPGEESAAWNPAMFVKALRDPVLQATVVKQILDEHADLDPLDVGLAAQGRLPGFGDTLAEALTARQADQSATGDEDADGWQMLFAAIEDPAIQVAVGRLILADRTDLDAIADALVRHGEPVAARAELFRLAHSAPVVRGGGVNETSPLSQLAVELLLAHADRPDVVAGVTVNPEWVVVERGPADLDPERFRLRQAFIDHYGLLGR